MGILSYNHKPTTDCLFMVDWPALVIFLGCTNEETDSDRITGFYHLAMSDSQRAYPILLIESLASLMPVSYSCRVPMCFRRTSHGGLINR